MDQNNRAKKIWLVGLILMTLTMIGVGGATRLTRSGLSIVEWKPVTGILPPLTDAAWQAEFEKYKASPEYQKVNSHFELEEYKGIFYWEYFHRVLGRLIFLYVLIPGLLLWRKSKVSGRLVSSLAGLVMLQGLMGWVMVKSGLDHEPRVSPFLLAAHFFLALTLMISAYYQIAKTRPKIAPNLNNSHIRWIRFLGFVLGLQVFYGCLTSGLKAGHASNTFPLMGGEFFPSELLFSIEPSWVNFFENPYMVQWTHRWLGILTATIIYGVSLYCLKRLSGIDRRPFFHIMGISTAQVAFGILLLVWQVPIWLGLVHQSVAALVVLGYCNIIFRLKRAGPGLA